MDLKKYIGGQGVGPHGEWCEIVDADEASGLLLAVHKDGGDVWLSPRAFLDLEEAENE